jgi:ABC-2 type transport system permease protein
MRNILAIVQREFRSYFTSPIAYIVLAIFVFLTGIFFQTILAGMMETSMRRSIMTAQTGQPPQPMDMPGLLTQGLLSTLSVILLFMVPMITMALFSEEKKRGTIELLLTSPITDLQVVLGKFFAAAAFFGVLLASTGVEVAILYLYSDPATGPILSAYLGLLLYGLSVVAIGMFISTLTENQIVAAVMSFGVIMVLWLIDVMANRAEGTTKSILTHLSILSHLDDFLKGVLDTSHVIFYISLMLVGLFLTYRSLDSLRWRG